MAAPEDPAEQPEAPHPDAAPPDEPAAADTAPVPPVDAPVPPTVEQPGPVPPDATAADLPAAGVPASPPGPPDATTIEPPRWAARARVPTPQAGREYTEEWAVEQPRSTVLPVLLTIIVMLLLGVFGVGIWLLLSNRPTPLPPEQQTETTAVTTTRATTPATTATTSATATTNTVPMPDIVGKTYADAAAALTAVGLVPDRHDEFSDTVPEGTVITTDKPKDTPLAPGTVISVTVSKGPQPTATATATATTTATEGGPKHS